MESSPTQPFQDESAHVGGTPTRASGCTLAGLPNCGHIAHTPFQEHKPQRSCPDAVAPGGQGSIEMLTRHTKPGSITSTKISISTGSYSATNWSHCQAKGTQVQGCPRDGKALPLTPSTLPSRLL